MDDDSKMSFFFLGLGLGAALRVPVRAEIRLRDPRLPDVQSRMKARILAKRRGAGIERPGGGDHRGSAEQIHGFSGRRRASRRQSMQAAKPIAETVRSTTSGVRVTAPA